MGVRKDDKRLEPVSESKLAELLSTAFGSTARFNEFLQYRLNRRLIEFEQRDDRFPDAVLHTIQELNREVAWRRLLLEARNAVPADGALMAFAEEHEQGFAPLVVDSAKGKPEILVAGPELELRVRKFNASVDIKVFREKLGMIESQVCRIEFPPRTAQATGFLVGRDVVMTNYHVVEELRRTKLSPSQVLLRFDYKVGSDGVTVAKGKEYGLADDWLLDESRYSPLDLAVDPKEDPRADQLDCALLRVKGNPGSEPVGGDTADPKATPRKWIEVPQRSHDFDASPAVLIVQHPDGDPMRLALDTEALLRINGNKTRVYYTTETKKGSSGSPCFNYDLDWVALHHAGDPRYYQLKTPPKFNRGIPVQAIVDYLKKRGKAGLLGMN